MQARLRLPVEVFADLERVLRLAEPDEQGLFLLVGHAVAGDDLIVTARETRAPPAAAWRLQGKTQLAPSTAWMSEMLGEADERGLGLAFVHSHPGERGMLDFSGADEWMHEQLVPVMVSNLDGRAFASFVYARGVLRGAAWWNGARLAVGRATVVGSTLRELGPPPVSVPPTNDWDRQVRLWGREGQDRLARLRVGVVGFGGTGSPTVEELLRLGIGEIVVVDHQLLEATNVSRVWGSRREQIGMPKVAVAKAHLESVRPRVIVPVHATVESPEAIAALAACNLIVGCTDNHRSRSVLNDIAMQYLVPLIDVGCRVVVHPDHGSFIPVEVRHVEPGGPCLWCMKAIDGRRIREEMLPREEHEQLAREGYVAALDEEPSVIAVTTTVASLGLLKFLGAILGVVNYPGSRLVGDLHDLSFTFVEDEKDGACVCGERLARGDLRRIA